jgi:hypothetical protein
MPTKFHRAALILPLILFVALTGCAKVGTVGAPALTPLQIVANAEVAIPQGVTIVANTSTALVNQGAMTPAEGTKVAALLTDIINANVRAVAATKAISTLAAAGNTSIAAIITPIIKEAQESITSGDVFNIKNAAAKAAITTALSSLVVTLQIIQAKVGT